MDREAFQTWTAGHIRLLDGATGSNLRAAGMPAGVCSEDWIRSHPDTLQSLQRAYVDAGSEIILATDLRREPRPVGAPRAGA